MPFDEADRIELCDVYFINSRTVQFFGLTHCSVEKGTVRISGAGALVEADLEPWTVSGRAGVGLPENPPRLRFSGQLGFPKDGDFPETLIVEILSPGQDVLLREKVPMPSRGEPRKDCFKVSTERYMAFGDTLKVTGWLPDADSISRIELRAGWRREPADLHQHRPDVLLNNSGVGTEFSGFSVALSGLKEEGERRMLVAFDQQDREIWRRPVGGKAEPEIRRGPTPRDLVWACHDVQFGLLTVYVATRDLSDRVRLHLKTAEGNWQLTHAQSLSIQKCPPALLLHKPTAVVRGVFELECEAEDLPDMQLMVEGELGCYHFPQFNVTRRTGPEEGVVRVADYCPDTHVFFLSGICPSVGTTHVQVRVGERVVGIQMAFLEPHATALEALQAGFYFEFLGNGTVESRVTVKFFSGERLLQEVPVVLRERYRRQNPILGSASRTSQGAVHYQFQSALERETAPWVLYAIGMQLWPVVGGGAARSLSVARFLRAQGYRVALVVEHPEEATDNSVHALQGIADAVIFVPSQPRTAVFCAPDYAMYQRSNENLGPLLETLEAEYAPRVTLINFAFNLYAAENLSGPVLLDAHDVQHLRTRNARTLGGSLENRRVSWLEEERLLHGVDGIVAIQQEEQRILEELAPGKPVVTVGHTLQVPQDQESPGPSQLKRLLFVGQKYEPNIQGLRQFLAVAWPRLVEQYSDIELHVVGRVCEAFGDVCDPRVNLHGVAPDLEPFYRDCGIVINPTPFGTGFKIKTIEGLAHKCCVVATPNGALGLPKGAPLRVVEIDGFAKAIAALISDADAAGELARQGAGFVAKTYVPEHVYRPLVDLIETLPSPRPPAAPSVSLVGHEVRGSDLFLSLSVDSSEAGDGGGLQRFRAALEFAQGSRVEVWAAVEPEAGLVRIRIPLPAWSFGGLENRIEIEVNGRSVGVIMLCLPQPGSKVEAFLMPSWYFAGLNDHDSTMLVVPAGRRPDPGTMSGAGRGAEWVFTVYSGNRQLGHAVGPDPDPAQLPWPWLNQLVFVPRDLPKRVRGRMTLYRAGSGAHVGSFDAAAAHVISVPHQEPAGISGAPPQGVWHAGWPGQLPDNGWLNVLDKWGRGIDSGWLREDSDQEMRLIQLVRNRRGISAGKVLFPEGFDEDDILRWNVMLNGEPLCNSRQVVERNRQLNLLVTPQKRKGGGLYLVELVFLKTAPAAEAALPLALKIES